MDGTLGPHRPGAPEALDEDPELVRMVEHLAAENGETPNEMLARLARAQLKEELDAAFESAPGSRYRRILAEAFGGDVPIFDPEDERIDEL